MVASIVFTFESRVRSGAQTSGNLWVPRSQTSGNRAMKPSPRGLCVRAVFTAKA